MKSSEDFLKFLEFCINESFDMFVPEMKDGVFLDYYINDLIQKDRFNPAWLRNPLIATTLQLMWQQFDSEKNPDAEKVKKILDFAQEKSPECLSRKYKPTEHFKTYCGYEWCNKNGEITLGATCDFIKYHINKRNICVQDGIIFPDTWLRELLQESRPTFYESEIPVLVQKLLI